MARCGRCLTLGLQELGFCPEISRHGRQTQRGVEGFGPNNNKRTFAIKKKNGQKNGSLFEHVKHGHVFALDVTVHRTHATMLWWEWADDVI